jgi:uncharacterized protein (DUF433 family)
LTAGRKDIIFNSEETMNWDERIEVKPGVMMGKPVIKGTRITVEIILERLNAGESVEQIANSYRNIDIHDVHAVSVRKK